MVGRLDAEDSFFAGSTPCFDKEPPLLRRTLPASESAAVFDCLSFKICLEGATLALRAAASSSLVLRADGGGLETGTEEEPSEPGSEPLRDLRLRVHHR